MSNIRAEVINFDLTTKEGWDNYLDKKTERIAKRAKHKEFKLAEQTLIVTQDPRTEEPLPRPLGVTLLTAFVGNTDDEVEECKESFAMLIRSVSIAGRAIASSFLSEIWMSHRVIDTTKPAPAGPLFQGQPRNDPNRQEALMLMAEHRQFGNTGRIAVITRKNNKRIIEPWSNPGDQMIGRFAGTLVSEQAMNDPVIRWAAREYINMNKKFVEIFELRNPHAATS